MCIIFVWNQCDRINWWIELIIRQFVYFSVVITMANWRPKWLTCYNIVVLICARTNWESFDEVTNCQNWLASSCHQNVVVPERGAHFPAMLIDELQIRNVGKIVVTERGVHNPALFYDEFEIVLWTVRSSLLVRQFSWTKSLSLLSLRPFYDSLATLSWRGIFQLWPLYDTEYYH